MTFLELVHTDAKLIWDGEAHRARSITKAERFAAFEDFESRCITAFKPSHIHRFFDHLAECGLSNNTINHYGAMVVKVMGWACNEEFITHVPKFKYRKVKGALHDHRNSNGYAYRRDKKDKPRNLNS
jgi:hypothetical protein